MLNFNFRLTLHIFNRRLTNPQAPPYVRSVAKGANTLGGLQMLTKTRPAPHVLTFVAPTSSGGTNFWMPERSGDWAEDHALGISYAVEFLDWLATHGNALVFGAIMRAMTAGGIYEGVEVGFCQAIGIELVGLLQR